MGYLTVKDEGAFDDLKKIERPSYLSAEEFKECRVCKGHGYWNLTLNAYGPGRHFQGVCGHCNGSGYVHNSVTCEGHEWTWVRNLGRCYNLYECIHCGAKSEVDSSD